MITKEDKERRLQELRELYKKETDPVKREVLKARAGLLLKIKV